MKANAADTHSTMPAKLSQLRRRLKRLGDGVAGCSSVMLLESRGLLIFQKGGAPSPRPRREFDPAASDRHRIDTNFYFLKVRM
jgi:hypothetical protein